MCSGGSPPQCGWVVRGTRWGTILAALSSPPILASPRPVRPIHTKVEAKENVQRLEIRLAAR